MLLDHWLKGSEKSFSKLDNHVHNRKAASSITLLASKESLENIILFLFCQILQVTASHQHLHLAVLIPPAIINPCWRKCCFGSFGKTAEMFSHDTDSHQIGMIFLQWKNKCPASSSIFLQNGQLLSTTSICLLCKFILEGSLFLSNLHANTAYLDGTFSFHSSSKASSCIPSTSIPLIRL